jgi:hypothetical protein
MVVTECGTASRVHLTTAMAAAALRRTKMAKSKLDFLHNPVIFDIL